MHAPRTQLALDDIRENIEAVREFLHGMTLEDFVGSRLHFYAVTRAVEIISEASRRLPEELRQKHRQLPWKEIIGVGNVYRHDYGSVRNDLVWSTATIFLDPLMAMVDEEMPPASR